MTVQAKSGPISAADLETQWRSVTDPAYSRGLEDAGDGKGLEVIGQSLAQHARVSLAVDRTTQGMFLKPWSGQSDAPASGGAFSEVACEITRTGANGFTVVFDPGAVLVQEVTSAAGPTGPVELRPGRRYVISDRVVFPFGVGGASAVTFVAENLGRSYDEPPAGDINEFVQPGAGYTNTGATVVPGITLHRLACENFPEVVIPAHVGQMVLFVSGSNANQLRRVVGYELPDLTASPPSGGTLLLAAMGTYAHGGVTGAFTVGERVTATGSGAHGYLLGVSADQIVIDRIDGTFAVADVITGDTSGATATVSVVTESEEMTAETATAEWRFPTWAELGFTVANTAQPSGGRLAMLDALGEERNVRRASGEDDDSYRKRVATAPDVVTPKALLRAANRVLAPYGLHANLYEASQPSLPSVTPDLADYYDKSLSMLFGPITGTFFEGEPVTQNSIGTAKGRAVMRQPVAAEGAPIPAATFVGVTNAQRTFVPGYVATGQRSGATIDVATVVEMATVENRFHVMLTYSDFRAFFLIGVPNGDLGDFGFAYDIGDLGAYDSGPLTSGAYDGAAVVMETIWSAVWAAVNRARAGGVGFELVLD